MVEKALSKAFEKARNLIDRVGKGQADDAPIDLPGTHKRRDTHGNERMSEADIAQGEVTDTAQDPPRRTP